MASTTNTIDNIITDGSNTITLAGNVSFGGTVTSTGTITFNGNADFGGAVAVAGALTTGGAFTTTPANDVTLTTTGPTNVTLPTSGTLATTAQIGNLPLTVVTATTQQMASNNRYAANNAALVTLTLPLSTSTNPGDILQIVGYGAGGWSIAQNASDICYIGASSTTAGTGGSVASTHQYDNLTLTNVAANVWIASQGYVGNLTVV